jgi:hypothetical protein
MNAPIVSAKRSSIEAVRFGTNIWCTSSVTPYNITRHTDMRKVADVIRAGKPRAKARTTRTDSPQYAIACHGLSAPPGTGGDESDEATKIPVMYTTTGNQS